jgi:hypothetical protein
MAPNKRYTEVTMGEAKLMQSMFDGKKGYQAQMGQKKEMEADEIKDATDDKAIIPQLFYLSSDYKTTYLGTGKVGSEDAYKLKITKPSGKVSVEYYSTKTGLLLREEKTTEAQGTEMTILIDYGNYKKVGTVLLPFSITQSVGDQEFSMNVSDIKINEGVTEADFK